MSYLFFIIFFKFCELPEMRLHN